MAEASTCQMTDLLACEFVHGLMSDLKRATDPVIDRLVGCDHQTLPDTNPHNRLRRLSELRDVGQLSAQGYESKRR